MEGRTANAIAKDDGHCSEGRYAVNWQEHIQGAVDSRYGPMYSSGFRVNMLSPRTGEGGMAMDQSCRTEDEQREKEIVKRPRRSKA